MLIILLFLTSNWLESEYCHVKSILHLTVYITGQDCSVYDKLVLHRHESIVTA